MQKAIIYAAQGKVRVRQEVKTQKRYCQNYAESEGIKVIEVVTDIGKKENIERPGIKKYFKN